MEGREKFSSPDPNRKDFPQTNPLQTGTIYRKFQTRIIQDVSHVKGKRNKTAKHLFKDHFIKITAKPNTLKRIKPIDAGKFGYHVSVRKTARTDSGSRGIKTQ